MASIEPHPHFVLFPLMAPGHMIPMMDIAKILARHNVIVTVVTTPHNAARFSSTFEGYQIRLAQVQFPVEEVGLPNGCENFDMIQSRVMSLRLLKATNLLRQPVEKLFEELTPPPSCIISDMCLSYTRHISSKFKIPRISFVGANCFYSVCTHNLSIYNVAENIATKSEHFLVPGIPDQIEITKAQVETAIDEKWEQLNDDMREGEKDTYGVLVNSFQELESAYAGEYKKLRNDKVWCIGPVSLSNKEHLDQSQRGNKASIDEWHQHLKWLDSQNPRSVIYACFGSTFHLTAEQLIELALALEASKRPFIWVIRKVSQLKAWENWLKQDGYVERVNDRGLIIRGWASQLLILSHPSIGGFLTHCGWNSTLEAICAGVPMVTWPLYGDQFLNERLVVQVLKVGVKVGVESPLKRGDEEDGTDVVVKKEDVERAIHNLMEETSESEERRKRIRELADMAKKAVEEGGSSYSNVNLFIQDIMKKSTEDI